MADLWIALMPLLLALTLSPGRTTVLILLFKTSEPVQTTSAFVSGMMTVMIVQGIFWGTLFSVIGLASVQRGGDLVTVLAILYIVIAFFLFFAAGKLLRQSDEEKKALPDWLSKLETFTSRQAFSTGFGVLMVSPKQWALVSTVVAVIYSAYLSVPASILNFLAFAFLVQAAYFVLIGLYVLVPQRAGTFLDSLFRWLKAHFRPVAIGLFGLLGAFFLVKGISVFAS